MIQELYPDNAVMQKKVLQMINRKALFSMSGKTAEFPFL